MIYTFELDIDWGLVNQISAIDRFDVEWIGIERRERENLKHFKSMTTVESVGASTRLEGAKLDNDQIDALIKNMEITQLEYRDQQEVVGYYNALDTIAKDFNKINITENIIKGLHNELLRHVEKDQWHRGNYKQHSNSVEASLEDGTKEIIFETTPPGIETEDAMRSLIEWYNGDSEVNRLVKAALFSYEFVSIHPFQDGNGRMSRLLSTLLLLQNGYRWIEYVSFEHEIERNKKAYYTVLRSCQINRPGENVNAWVSFYLSSLENLTKKLKNKIERTSAKRGMSEKEKKVFRFIEGNPGAQISQISGETGIKRPTVKVMLIDMTRRGLIEMHGVGRGINYTIL